MEQKKAKIAKTVFYFFVALVTAALLCCAFVFNRTDVTYAAEQGGGNQTAAGNTFASPEFIITVSVAGALIIALAVIIILMCRSGARKGFKYKLLINADGIILKADERFKRAYPQTIGITGSVDKFDSDKLNAISVKSGETERALACLVNKLPDGNMSVVAAELNASALCEVADPKNTMNNTFATFTEHGRVLVGDVFFGNMHNLKAMFGMDFALAVRAVMVRKLAEKFIYVYDVDTYHVGVLLPEGPQFDDVVKGMDGIMNYFNQPVAVADSIVNAGVKAGFAVCDDKMANKSFDYCVSAAGAALNRAEQDGSRSYYIYYEAQKEHFSKFFVQFDIIRLLQEDAFELYYQPQYSFGENRIVGFEALFRVKKNVNLNINTGDLIAYAERAGYMVHLGNFILDTGMKFAKSIEERGVTVSLNISPIQLLQAGFVENFMAFYRKYQLKPGVVSVEITESFLMSTFEETLQKLKVLRDNGISIHLDNFGIGYSSLLHLKSLPICAIKIDKGFIDELLTSEYSRAVIDMMLGIAKELNLACIAEGVETLDQAERLKEMGCEEIQGYLVSRAIKGEDAVELLNNYKFDL